LKEVIIQDLAQEGNSSALGFSEADGLNLSHQLDRSALPSVNAFLEEWPEFEKPPTKGRGGQSLKLIRRNSDISVLVRECLNRIAVMMSIDLSPNCLYIQCDLASQSKNDNVQPLPDQYRTAT
jgi:hypothetical protein